MRATYSPPAIRHWVQDQETQLSSREIDCRRYSCCRGICNDGTNNIPTQLLHNHFCLNQGDRELAFHEGMGDIKDAVIGLGRLADGLFVGFGVWPEWNTSVPLYPSDIVVNVIHTHQLHQFPQFEHTVERMRSIFAEEIALTHILSFGHKLDLVRLGPGYVVDPLTRSLMVGNISLVPGQPYSVEVPPSPRTSAHTLPLGRSAQLQAQRQQQQSTQRASFASIQFAPPQTVYVSDSDSDSETQQRLPPPQQHSVQRAASVSIQFAPHRTIYISDSDSDSETLESSSASWIITPPGSPQHTSWIAIPPGSPHTDRPLDYYNEPSVTMFNFSSATQEYLRGLNASARMLCQINATLNRSISEWIHCFKESGLTHAQAHQLRAIILHGLSDDDISTVLASVGL
ncbi:uncharacterized protein EDB91DRAFT_1258135 [Suillus paluster]|uniref:uncharacterized protein n=1 Tax=Suillus paluster TaxID=48578 RepID=UPI001B87C7D0|nr:uncharacterized protein EDB91DRAFT_1258135 [Suillus paluster]KAG1718844.1 hypothetical protein EDB91DRAFT_1258135 [Suillus paluster]